MVQIILNGTQKEKKVKSPKDNSTVATGFVAKYGTFQPICGFSVITKGSDQCYQMVAMAELWRFCVVKI